MTIEELVESFAEAEDPAHPQPEELSLGLHKHNVRRGGSKAPKMFQVRIQLVCVCVADAFLWCYAMCSQDNDCWRDLWCFLHGRCGAIVRRSN